MKKVFFLLSLLLSIVSFGQENKAPDTDGKNGPKSASEIKSPEKIVQLFYNNLNDVKVLEPVISSKLYQKKTFAEFQDFLIEKNKRLGKMLEKKLVKMQKSDNTNTVTYLYNVKYENDKALEELRLARANEKEAYKIIAYNIIK